MQPPPPLPPPPPLLLLGLGLPPLPQLGQQERLGLQVRLRRTLVPVAPALSRQSGEVLR